jgi:signal transduction histidine kinase
LDFRTRSLGRLVLLILLAVGLQSLVGYVSFKNSLDRDLLNDLQKYLIIITEALDFSAEIPELVPSRLPTTSELQGRFRLSRDGVVFVEGGGPFPVDDPEWMLASARLSSNYYLEVALNQFEHNRALLDYTRASLIALLVSLLLVISLALLMQGFVMQPLRRLREATEGMARDKIPQPLQIKGSDEVAHLMGSFNRMVEKVRGSLERERSFTRYASHELRTPLTSLKTNLAAVEAGTLSPQDLIPVVQRSVRRMEGILGGLLLLARGLESPSRVRASSLVIEAAEEFSNDLMDRLFLNLPEETPELIVPHAALVGALYNLLDNALKYSPGTVEVTISLDPEVVFLVRDYGPGANPSLIERLVEPFFRGSRKIEGTGLGLAYVNQVAQSLGGQLVLENLPDGGFQARLILGGEVRV